MLSCEQSIVRSFPVSCLTKEKRITRLYLPHLDQELPEGLQLRSCTFQLIKVAFDEEIAAESIEGFRKLINRARHPPHEFGHFAFASHGIIPNTPLHKVKEKNATLKGFAKKTLIRTAKRAGFKQKGVTRRKYVLPGVDFDDTSPTNEHGGNNIANSNSEHHLHNLNVEDDSDDAVDTMPRVTVKDIERLKERSYVRDWKRLGFSEPHSNYRISSANCNYSLCRSYPGKPNNPLKNVSFDLMANSNHFSVFLQQLLCHHKPYQMIHFGAYLDATKIIESRCQHGDINGMVQFYYGKHSIS